jgi:hypothetical protein
LPPLPSLVVVKPLIVIVIAIVDVGRGAYAGR